MALQSWPYLKALLIYMKFLCEIKIVPPIPRLGHQWGALVSRLHFSMNYNRFVSLMQNAETLKNRACHLVPSHLEDLVEQWLHSYRQCIAVYLLKIVALELLSFNFVLVYIYACVHVHVCMRTWVHIHVYACMEDRGQCGCLPQSLPFVFFKGRPPDPETHWFGETD